MNELSEYEKLRQKNIQENRKVLENLGLLKPFQSLPKRNKNEFGITKTKKRKRTEGIKSKAEAPKEKEGFAQLQNYINFPRRSLRVRGLDADNIELPSNADSEEENVPAKSYRAVERENSFGFIPDIPVGTTWATRLECSRDGVHRPTVAGIHGSETEGCYSLALSGGYEDDIDLGDSFTYTGEGGRDLKGTKANPKNLRTAPQSKDQTLRKGNLALTRNVENRRPVRVIRGYKLSSAYAPTEGYRYDGLYYVERYWQAVGLSGFKVYKFVLNRCPNQEPSPWLESDEKSNENSE